MVLVEHKADCCGCGACALICPTGAIRMKTDENGCVYPEIQQEKCISCGLCKARCAFQHADTKTNERQQVYALCRKDSERLMRSASGGVFAAIAEQWIEAGGIVYGAALSRRGEVLVPVHLQASTAEELEPLLGSKYVQSDVTAAYPAVRQNLREGRQVLFSGTPCQVAGLKSYLKQEYENLLTIDLVCHGVPGADWFAGYLSELEKRLGGKVQDFRFRDKHHGWGLNARLEYQKRGRHIRKNSQAMRPLTTNCF